MYSIAFHFVPVFDVISSTQTYHSISLSPTRTKQVPLVKWWGHRQQAVPFERDTWRQLRWGMVFVRHRADFLWSAALAAGCEQHPWAFWREIWTDATFCLIFSTISTYHIVEIQFSTYILCNPILYYMHLFETCSSLVLVLLCAGGPARSSQGHFQTNATQLGSRACLDEVLGGCNEMGLQAAFGIMKHYCNQLGLKHLQDWELIALWSQIVVFHSSFPGIIWFVWSVTRDK